MQYIQKQEALPSFHNCVVRCTVATCTYSMHTVVCTYVPYLTCTYGMISYCIIRNYHPVFDCVWRLLYWRMAIYYCLHHLNYIIRRCSTVAQYCYGSATVCYYLIILLLL